MTDEKIIRIPGETLMITFSPEEALYRNKYLPDPSKLTNEKLVCTVCSKSLATDIHKGKDVFVHRVLNVLTCEICYNFYGDGNFSVDEDGDDKYCRWCGQGGTLYLCSTCTCAFCQKCVKQNLKASVLAELEKDDWKCYVCNPRPLFGTRTICWGAEQLNKVGKEKERERLIKLEEKKKEESEKRSRKVMDEADETTKKRKRKSIDSDSDSPEVLPSKKSRKNSRAQNGYGKSRKPNSDSDSSEDEKVLKRSKVRTSLKKKNISYAESSSEDDLDVKHKTKKSIKRSTRDTSDESSDDKKRKSKKRLSKKKKDSSDDESSDDRSKHKKKSKKKYQVENSDSSSEEIKKKKKSDKHKKNTSSDDSSDDDKKKSSKQTKKKKEMSSGSDEDERKKKKAQKSTKKSNEQLDSDSECKKSKPKKDDETSLDENGSKTNTNNSTNEDKVVKKRIKLAVVWLSNAAKDIEELGTLISVRALKFKQKKINCDSLKTYEDVTKTVNKVKQLITGVHSNYDHIEKNLDAHFKPWKILTGLEDIEGKSLSEKNKEDDENNSTNNADKTQKTNNLASESPISSKAKSTSSEKDKSKPLETEEENIDLQWSGDSDSEKQTSELISKASAALEKMDEEESSNLKCVDKEETSKIRNQDVNDSPNPKEKIKSSPRIADKDEQKGDLENGKNNESDKELEENNKREKTGDRSECEEPQSPCLKKKTQMKENSSKTKPKRRGKKSKAISRTPVKEKQDIPEKISEQVEELSEDSVWSSNDSFTLGDIGKKLEEKWCEEDKPEKMKLVAPLGSDSSEDEKDKPLPSRSKRKVKDSSGESDSEKTIPKEKDKNTVKNKSETKRKNKSLKLNKADSKKEESNKKENIKNSSKKSKLSSDSKEEKLSKTSKRGLSSDSEEEKISKLSQNLLESDDSEDMPNLKSKPIEKKKAEKKGKKNCHDSNPNSQDSDGKDSIELNQEEKKEIESPKNNKTPDNKSKAKNGVSKETLEGSPNIKSEGSEPEVDGKSTQPLKDKKSRSDDEKEQPNNKTNELCGKQNDDDLSVSKKFVSLGSSSDEEDKESSLATKNKDKNISSKQKPSRNLKSSKNTSLLESSDEENEEEINTSKLESSDEENKPSESTKDEIDKDSQSGSMINLTSDESSDEEIFQNKKKKQKTKSSESESEEDQSKTKRKKRKLVRCASSSNESDGSESGEKGKNSKSPGKSPGKGRKNIKKIKKDLAESTIEAAEEEKERRRRIEERQKLFNQVFEVKETESLKKLVLDFDPKSKEEILSVNKDLVSKMKPHQAKGVKFMWDSCFESIEDCKKKKGSGCILAHCMGLGKTFQVISLVHTLLMNEDTQVRTVMVVCPLSTVLNWFNEFDKWLENVEGGSSIDVYHLTRLKNNPERAGELRHWQKTGGVLIMGYEMFRNLTCETTKKFRPKMKKDFQETLVDPGADVIVCDEGHMLKNEQTALSKAMSRVKTLRRIVLTGTPMQNNLVEYHCMVQFVKPSLLGTKKEFLNRFVNPITNGQFVDSTERDVKIMKRRAHVLHKMLEGLVQRFDYNVLTPFLPPKHEYVVAVCLSELQIKLYQHYLDNFSQRSDSEKAGSRLFQDWQALGRIWTHPRVIKMSSDKAEERRAKMEETDEEGSLKDFIDDDDSEESSASESESSISSEGSVKSNPKKRKVVQTRRKTRSNAKNDAHLESEEDENKVEEGEGVEKEYGGAWWSDMVKPEDLDDMRHSGKLMLLFSILKECDLIEDKVLVFSQSLFSLDLIEYFLDKIDTATQEGRLDESLGNHQGNWSKGLDYFRLDGSTSSDNRNLWCKAFNREDNPRARLFLISTRAGGLGINLTAANRVIIFDASWNPSHDVQSIFRVYRFGQKKPCYVYRFIAHGTMEEKVYDRQVAKQSMSNRVVDEQQVHRHFTSNDLNELYSFTPPSKPEDRPTPALPKDHLMAELLAQFKEWIEKYHEHDSLLENVESEELNEEERKLAWEDYETEKKRGFMPNYANNSGGAVNNPMHIQIEILRQKLKIKYPDLPDEQLNQLLVHEVSMLMRQQEMLKQQQRIAQQQYAQQQMAAQVMQMRQQQQQMQQQQAQFQMKQMLQKVPPGVFLNQQSTSQPSLLSTFLNMPGSNMQMPPHKLNNMYPQMTPNFRMGVPPNLGKVAPKKQGVVITEIKDDDSKPSSS